MTDKILWCVETPDGVHAMPSKSEARQWSKRMRTFFKGICRGNPSQHWPAMWFEVKRWMHDGEYHQEEVHEYLSDKREAQARRRLHG